MSSGGTSAPVTTQTQNAAPWSGAQPFLSQLYTTAQQNFQNNIGYQPYGGATQAAVDPTLQAALQGTLGLAQQQAQGPQLGQALNTMSQLQTNNMGPAVNPYLTQTLGQITDQVASGMSGAGRYGSQDYAAAIARGEAPTLAQAFQQQEQIAGQAAQAVPGLAQAQYLPYQMQTDVGQFYQNRAQQDLNAQIALYNAQQAYPWQQLERYGAIMAGAGQLGGTTVTGTTTQVPLAQRLLGGGLAGAGLGGAVGGPFGAGIGGLGGALLGGFI